MPAEPARVEPETGSHILGNWLSRRRVPALLEPLEAAARAHNPRFDTGGIEHAFAVAEVAHRGQSRKSGEPYITHPVAVATILAELGMDTRVLQAALLHDTVEDTDYTLEQLTKDFGDEVAMLVDGVTKLDKVTYGAAAQAETVRKMVVAMARDVRVLVIKLADRLHNARTWGFVAVESAHAKARETLEIYAPLAHRMGMNTLKWELEDLSFATLYPRIYHEIVAMVHEHAPQREEYLARVREDLNAILRTARIKATVTSRPKHYYSIYQKMIVRGREFGEINDLIGMRVLVDSLKDCYGVLGTVHGTWAPVAGRIKDYIAMPKFNLYQSLHTTVIGPDGRLVEIQIRTHDMHRRAEYGIAAHWKYKERGKSKPQENELAWIRNIFDWQQETTDSAEFLESMRYEMAGTEIYVFTPKGQVIALPQGSTPVDFAYSVHTEVGHRTMGAKVNGRLVPLDSPVSHGDVIEILTSKQPTAGPSRDWLNFAKSQRARSKIKQWFTKERREEAIELGKRAIAKQMRKQDLPLQRLLTHEAMSVVATELRFADVSSLYASVGESNTSAVTVVNKIVASVGGEVANDEDMSEVVRPGIMQSAKRNDPGITVDGVDDIMVKLAKCCTPMPGDDIAGFVTRGSGISIHRDDCENILALQEAQPDRVVNAQWSGDVRGVYLVYIQVEALDRSGLLSEITRVLSDNHVNILSAAVSTGKDRITASRFTFELADPSHLSAVLAAVRKVDGVFDVHRVTGSGAPRPE